MQDVLTGKNKVFGEFPYTKTGQHFVWDSINTPNSSDILQGPAIATMTNASGSNNLVWFLPAINDEGHNHNILDIENNYP